MKEDDSGLLLALRTEWPAKAGGRADHPRPPAYVTLEYLIKHLARSRPRQSWTVQSSAMHCPT